ncbi:MAG: aminotransferase class I/II-fold pyridoxal phosphate-dependent enzyme, partial [Patescibacteria group bacterium]
MKSTIFTGFAPNLNTSDTIRACQLLFCPWRWRVGDSGTKAVQWLEQFFGTTVFLCDSGRSALAIALRGLGIKAGDEVLVQAFTCLVVINAIRSVGGVPVYVDIGRDFNMDPADVAKKITPQTKVIIIQHTFGIPAPMSQLLDIAKKYSLLTIEDSAHALGGTFGGKKLGTFGDLAIITFGSDKVVSCVRGGGIIVNNRMFQVTISKLVQELPLPPRRVVLQHLLHYPFFGIGKRLYSLGVWKAIVWLAHILCLISRTI